MKNFLRAIIGFVILAFLGILIMGLLLPSTYSVSRSIMIDSDLENIHAYVGDLAQWEAWTPWRDHDPDLAVTLGRLTQGVGASQSWKDKQGEGSLRFTMSSPTNGIAYDLFFNDTSTPCKSTIIYEPKEESIKVTWTLSGTIDRPWVGGYISIITKAVVGQLFDEGLEKLKKQAERS